MSEIKTIKLLLEVKHSPWETTKEEVFFNLFTQILDVVKSSDEFEWEISNLWGLEHHLVNITGLSKLMWKTRQAVSESIKTYEKNFGEIPVIEMWNGNWKYYFLKDPKLIDYRSRYQKQK